MAGRFSSKSGGIFSARGSGKSKFSLDWRMSEGVARKLFFMRRKTFLRRMRVMSKARMPMADALVELQERALGELKDKPLDISRRIDYAALSSMALRLKKGRTLAQAFAGWFSPTDIMLLDAGERRGYEAFAEAIDDVLELQDAVTDMLAYIFSGLFEPAIMLLSVYGLIVWMSTEFVEKVMDLLKIEANEFTGSAYGLYIIGKFGQTSLSWIVPLALIGLVVLVFMSLPGAVFRGKTWFCGHQRGVLDRLLPPWSVYLQLTGSRWLLSFAKLVKAGYTYEEILSKTKALASPWLAVRLGAIERAYRKGVGLGVAMRMASYRFPSDEVIDDLDTFANRPGFEESLNVIAKEWIREATRRVKALSVFLTLAGFLATGLSMLWVMESFNSMQNQITKKAEQKMRV